MGAGFVWNRSRERFQAVSMTLQTLTPAVQFGTKISLIFFVKLAVFIGKQSKLLTNIINQAKANAGIVTPSGVQQEVFPAITMKAEHSTRKLHAGGSAE